MPNAECSPLKRATVDAEGIVVRCVSEDSRGDSFRIAILFSKLSDDAHQAIKEYVEQDLLEADKA